MKQDILDLNNKNVGTIELDDSIFGLEVRADILHRVVVWQLARRQAGTHLTKGRSDVALTPAKPFKQKGSGNARQGSRKGTQFRKGGVVFGPVVRSYEHDLTKKFRKLGLKTALSAKAKEGNLIVIDEAKLSEAKTKDLQSKLNVMGLKNCLFIDGKAVDVNFALASRNINGVDILPTIGANVYDILRKEKLVLTKEAVACLKERLTW
ncbi:MAG: 50S ribosomal protein L4 [Alphaproteobacteria bacterium]|nr:50S ribosomal protein L4 [Alphaproteobacteria bacterium]MBQ7659246.1 50S ribosomal protein L4 [Alphaproteobacteria bacterium]